MKFAITLDPTPRSYESPWREVAEILHYGLQELGQSSILTHQTDLPDHIHILVGSPISIAQANPLSPNTIIYNTDLIPDHSIDPTLLELWRRYPVWEIRASGVQRLQDLRCDPVQHLPLGYVPHLTRLPEISNKSIDVLLCHSSGTQERSERYDQISAALRQAGLRVESSLGIYGRQRDYQICKARLCLVLDPVDPAGLDLPLITYLLANQRLVVTEYSRDPDWEAIYSSGLVLTSAEDLVQICGGLLTQTDPSGYHSFLALPGFTAVKERPMSRFLWPLIQPLLDRYTDRHIDRHQDRRLAEDPIRVDLGCGRDKPAGFLGVDVYPAEGVDIVSDLNQTFPFPDSSVAEIRAYDLVEHLHDRIHTMNEIWRVCKPEATVDILVPSTDGRGAFQDPTHVSYWNVNSFKYYSSEFPYLFRLCQGYGFKGNFQIAEVQHIISPTDHRIIHVHVILKAIKISVADRLIQHLGLRRFNVLVRPDWSQDPGALNEELVQIVRELRGLPFADQITLLIDRGNALINQELNLEEILYDVVLQVLLDQDSDIDLSTVGEQDSPHVTLIDPLSSEQSLALTDLIHCWIQASQTSPISSFPMALDPLTPCDLASAIETLVHLDQVGTPAASPAQEIQAQPKT